ncbi:MAG: hypothetical protein LC642_04640, partial [Verrucomicrobiaceae bacterium]|nr:hypothetical protein [Verrucomicrobiaceae bacterium]
RQPSNLIFAAVAFDDQQIARAYQNLFEFRISDADILHFLKSKLVRIHVCDAKIGMASTRQTRTFSPL